MPRSEPEETKEAEETVDDFGAAEAALPAPVAADTWAEPPTADPAAAATQFASGFEAASESTLTLSCGTSSGCMHAGMQPSSHAPRGRSRCWTWGGAR